MIDFELHQIHKPAINAKIIDDLHCEWQTNELPLKIKKNWDENWHSGLAHTHSNSIHTISHWWKQKIHAMKNRLVQISDFHQNVNGTSTHKKMQCNSKIGEFKCMWLLLRAMHQCSFATQSSRAYPLTKAINIRLASYEQLVFLEFFSFFFFSFCLRHLSRAHILNLTLIMTSRLKWPENISFAGRMDCGSNSRVCWWKST